MSIPCGTWSALRYVKPGPDVLRKLPDHVLGIPDANGKLPRSAIVANAMLDSVIGIVEAGCAHGASAMFESASSAATQARRTPYPDAKIMRRCGHTPSSKT